MLLRRIFVAVSFLLVSSSTFAGTIAQLRDIPLGSSVASIGGIEAVISNTTDLIASPNAASFHLQDATGGITVFGNQARFESMLAGLQEGDRVEAVGFVTSSFNGLLELIEDGDASLELVETGVGVTTQLISATDFADYSPTAESLESQLVRINGVTFLDSGLFEGVTNYVATDGDTTFTVRVNTNDNSVVGTPIPSGPVDLLGVFNQFDSTNPGPGVPGTDYQLYLRRVEDVGVVPEPSALALSGLVLATAIGWRWRAAWSAKCAAWIPVAIASFLIYPASSQAEILPTAPQIQVTGRITSVEYHDLVGWTAPGDVITLTLELGENLQVVSPTRTVTEVVAVEVEYPPHAPGGILVGPWYMGTFSGINGVELAHHPSGREEISFSMDNGANLDFFQVFATGDLFDQSPTPPTLGNIPTGELQPLLDSGLSTFRYTLLPVFEPPYPMEAYGVIDSLRVLNVGTRVPEPSAGLLVGLVIGSGLLLKYSAYGNWRLDRS